MQDAPSHPPRGRELGAIAAFGALAFGVAALALGQSSNWDLCNYHWYNGWAWLSGRGDADLAAAQLQTWFNPLLSAALYALLSSLPSALGTFVLGAVQGLNLILVYRIARALLPGRPRWLVAVVALVGVTGATQLGELGATFGDNLLTLPLLGAIALVVDRPAGRISQQRAICAGLLAGVAVGVKLTVAPFAAGIVLALPALASDRRDAYTLFAWAAAAALCGFLASGGFWMLELWQRYGNPLFPLFGAWFGGDYAPPADLRDLRYLPRSLAQYVFYPIFWADTPRIVSELWFLDLRVPFAFLAVLALPLWWRRAASPPLRYVLFALGVGYVGWLVLFGYYRYLALVEMLAPIVLVAALGTIPRSRKTVNAIAASVLAVVAVTTKPPDWGRLLAYGERYVDVALPDLAGLDRATIVLADDSALAFMIPSFAPTTRFVRISGNLMGPPRAPWRLDQEAALRIAAATGPLYALLGHADTTRAQEALARYGLRLAEGACRDVVANLRPLGPAARLCALQRDTAPPATHG